MDNARDSGWLKKYEILMFGEHHSEKSVSKATKIDAAGNEQ